MSLSWDQVAEGLRDFQRQKETFQGNASLIGQLFRAVIRSVNTSDLAAIKKELRHFDSVSRRWKS